MLVGSLQVTDILQGGILRLSLRPARCSLRGVVAGGMDGERGICNGAKLIGMCAPGCLVNQSAEQGFISLWRPST